jgi:hypothetical protein
MGNDRATCGIARENVVDVVKSSKRRSNGLKKAFERTIGSPYFSADADERAGPYIRVHTTS